MAEKVCSTCGAVGGPGSLFKGSRCEACAQQDLARRHARSALIHLLLFGAGLYVFFTGATGVLAVLLFALALYDVASFVATVFHEAAHALVGRVLGFTITEVSVGIGPAMARVTAGRTRFVLRLYPVSGHTAMIPHGCATRTRAMLATAAGPLSHLPLAWLAATVFPAGPEWAPYRSSTITLILLMGLFNLIPYGELDGRSLVRLLTMPDDAVTGLVHTGAAMEVARRLQAVEEGRREATPEDRQAFLDHLDDPTIGARDRAISLNNLAVADLYLGDPDLREEAETATAEAMELLPDHPAIRNTRGAVLINLGKDEEGIELMEPTMTAIPAQQRASSHTALALAHARLGKVFDARRHIAAAARLDHRPADFEEALILAGAMEADVVRRYADGRSPAEAARAVRADASGTAHAMGLALLAHIDATGSDADLRPYAEALISP